MTNEEKKAAIMLEARRRQTAKEKLEKEILKLIADFELRFNNFRIETITTSRTDESTFVDIGLKAKK